MAAARWWLIEADIGAGLTPTYQAVQGPTKPDPRLVETANGTSVKVTGPYATQAAAQAAIPKGARTGAGTPSNTGKTSIGKSLDDAAKSVVDDTGLDAIGDFFNRLTQANTWIRIAKVAGGGLLLIIGLVHITGADNAIATAARKVPLPI